MRKNSRDGRKEEELEYVIGETEVREVDSEAKENVKELGEKIAETIKDIGEIIKGGKNKVVKELGNKIRVFKTLKKVGKAIDIGMSSETTLAEKGKAILDSVAEIGIGTIGTILGGIGGGTLGGYIGGAIGAIGGPGGVALGVVLGSRIGKVVGSGVGAEIAVRGYDKVKEFLKSFGKK